MSWIYLKSVYLINHSRVLGQCPGLTKAKVPDKMVVTCYHMWLTGEIRSAMAIAAAAASMEGGK